MVGMSSGVDKRLSRSVEESRLGRLFSLFIRLRDKRLADDSENLDRKRRVYISGDSSQVSWRRTEDVLYC